MNIQIYGCRASVPVYSSGWNTRYGSNTSCVRVDTAGRVIVLDGGSGIVRLGAELVAGAKPGVPITADILLGHLHMDHIVGLSKFDPFWNRANDVRVFTRSRDGRPLERQVFGAFCPPYWPVRLEEKSYAKIIEINDRDPFVLAEGIVVTPMASAHPDGTTVFRIDADRSLVYLLDYEVGDMPPEPLVNFCRGADAVIFDAAYLPEDYGTRRGWGHSNWTQGVRLAELSGCGRMIFSHFSQRYSDVVLDNLAEKLDDSRYILAFDGMELDL